MSTERNAHILRMATRGVIEYDHIESLEKKYKKLIFDARDRSTDFDAREGYISGELLRMGETELRAAFLKADPTASLDDLEPPGYQFEGIAAALEPQPPLQWVVEPIFSKPSINFITGEPKNLKTLLTMDLAMAVASGQPWLTDIRKRLGYKTYPGTVIWFDLENGRRRILNRVSAFVKGRELTAQTPFGGTAYQSRGQTLANQSGQPTCSRASRGWARPWRFSTIFRNCLARLTNLLRWLSL